MFDRLKVQRRTNRMEFSLPVWTIKDCRRAVRTTNHPHDHRKGRGDRLTGQRFLSGPVAFVEIGKIQKVIRQFRCNGIAHGT